MASKRPREVRCPVHGFITLDEWTRDIVEHPVFQRLRRIRQLAWTDMLYPGAMHTRFEHSLGVMHTATRMFGEVVARGRDVLDALDFSGAGIERDKALVRIATLLHDVGHAPFSHAGEELLPLKEGGKRFSHEEYSAAIIRECMTDVIDGHKNNDIAITANEVADLIEGKLTLSARQRFWRQILTSQLDADRADYLLRDSHHIGVEYGRYDLERLLVSLTVAVENDTPVLVVEEGGMHAAEALILARYMMFTQVYFHRVRSIYDHHIAEAMKTVLAEVQKGDNSIADKSAYPAPTSKQYLEKYLEWSDWSALGYIAAGLGGEHGEILKSRNHYRTVYETPEVASDEDFDRLAEITTRLDTRIAYVGVAEKNWYNLKQNEITIVSNDASHTLLPLSRKSAVVSHLGASNQRRLYVPLNLRKEADGIVKAYSEELAAKKGGGP